MNDRYFVQSEQVRGEPRIYWVEDRERKLRFGCRQVSLSTANKVLAERWANDMNAAQHSNGDQ